MTAPERIVSLLPSATEIVCGLGLTDHLVGVSHECDYPEEIAGRPVLTAPKLDPSGGSAEIDAGVRRLVADGLGVYRIDVDRLAELRPDLIVTQDQCDVCAVPLSEVEAAARQCLGDGVSVVSLHPSALADVFADIRRVGDAAGRADAAEALVSGMEERLDRIRARHAHLRARPRVACIEWIEPLMLAGNWVPDLVELGGGTCGPASGQTSGTVTWDELEAYEPDVIIVMPCGFKLPQTRRELSLLTRRPEWARLPAVRNRRVYAVDGNAYLNRPGPRLADSAELLAGLIQPGFYAELIPADSYERVP